MLISSGTVVDGNGGNNYSYNFVSTAGNIDKSPITVNATSDRPLKETSALADEPIVMDSNNDVTVATAIRADRRIPILRAES